MMAQMPIGVAQVGWGLRVTSDSPSRLADSTMSVKIIRQVRAASDSKNTIGTGMFFLL
jgi:hypothetical protein